MELVYFRGLLVLGMVAALGGAMLALTQWGAVREREKTALAAAAAAEAKYEQAYRISSELQAQLQRQQADNQKLKEDLDEQIAKNGVYAACKLPVDGVRLYNQALASAATR